MSRRIRPDSIGRIHSGPAVSARCPSTGCNRLPAHGQATVCNRLGYRWPVGRINDRPVLDRRPGLPSPPDRNGRVASPRGSESAPVLHTREDRRTEERIRGKQANPPGDGGPTYLAASETRQEPQPGSPHPERNPSGAAALLTSPRAEPTGSSGPAYLTPSGTHREQQSGSPHREQTRQEQQSGSFHRERTRQEKAAQLTSPRAKPIGSKSPTHLTASAPAGKRSPSHRPISAPARVAPEVIPSCRGAPKCLPGTRTCVVSDAPLRSWKRLASAGKHA